MNDPKFKNPNGHNSRLLLFSALESFVVFYVHLFSPFWIHFHSYLSYFDSFCDGFSHDEVRNEVRHQVGDEAIGDRKSTDIFWDGRESVLFRQEDQQHNDSEANAPWAQLCYASICGAFQPDVEPIIERIIQRRQRERPELL